MSWGVCVHWVVGLARDVSHNHIYDDKKFDIEKKIDIANQML